MKGDRSMRNKTNRIITVIIAMILVVVAGLTDTISANAAKANAPRKEDYVAVFNATFYAANNPDLGAAGLKTEDQLFNHFVNSGMSEGRQGSEEFNVQAYRARYADLNAVYGNDLKAYYLHYIRSGKAEGRNGRADGKTPAVTPAPAPQTPVTTTPSLTGRYYQTKDCVNYKPYVYIDFKGYELGKIYYQESIAGVTGSIKTAYYQKTITDGIQVYYDATNYQIFYYSKPLMLVTYSTGYQEFYWKID